MDKHHYSIIAPSALKVCPNCGGQMRLAKVGSTFLWVCTKCEYSEPLTDLHEFSFNPLLNCALKDEVSRS